MSAAALCRQMLEYMEGYGLWQFQAAKTNEVRGALQSP
jgi:hypothetical protein